MSELFWLTAVQKALCSFFPKSHDRPWVDDLNALSGIVCINHNVGRCPKTYLSAIALDATALSVKREEPGG